MGQIAVQLNRLPEFALIHYMGGVMVMTEDSDKLYDRLLGVLKENRPNMNMELIRKSYLAAKNLHAGHICKCGESKICHSVNVAIILAELGMDEATICAGILHNLKEEESIPPESVAKEFGADVAFLIDGVSRLTQISDSMDKIELQAESLRKMFLAMAKDIRVIVIKLADRLQDMRTLKGLPIGQQVDKAKETMDIYAPIAGRLGISKIKIELEDLSFKYSEPLAYYELAEKISQTKKNRQNFVDSIVDKVSGMIKEAGIEAKIYGRAKHFFSIYRKMVKGDKDIEQIYDLFAVRIIVKNIKECYAALGVLHEHYTPIPGRFKDYIAVPKVNGYRSLHTTLIGDGQPFEVQIRTEEMHQEAEYGIAAHWKYKEGKNGAGELSEKAAQSAERSEEQKLSWLRQILELQNEMSDNREFMSQLKSDLSLFTESIYCFTPTGDVKNLVTGSTPVDFAYSIHSGVGNRMVGAKVNGKMVPIDYEIQNGDRVEIITSPNAKGPSRDWLKIVKTAQARSKINQFFKQELKEDNIKKGRELLEKYCKIKGYVYGEITRPEYREMILDKFSYKDWDAILSAVGHGGLKEGQVLNKAIEEYEKRHKKEVSDEEVLEAITENSRPKGHEVKNKGGIMVKGIDDVAVRFSKCCNPVPGDEIVGFITRGRGVSIHRKDCVNMKDLSENDKARVIEAEWQEDSVNANNESYQAKINIYANNRTGILADISRILTESDVSVSSMSSRVSKQGLATVGITFEIHGKDELRRLMEKFSSVESVIGIDRVTG